MKTIAVANQKGGVGKSTTVYHLADQARLEEMKVLVIDIDPQGNITTALSAHPLGEDALGIANVLSPRTSNALPQVITPTIWKNVDLAPTSSDLVLSSVRDELVISGAGREARLRQALEALAADAYDLVLIDCPPSIDLLTINALTAADAALIVTHSKQWSSAGLVHLLGNIGQIRAYYNPQLQVGGILVNQHEAGTTSGNMWLQELDSFTQAHNIRLITPPIPKRVVISDAVEAQCSLTEYPGNTQDLENSYAGALAQIMEGTY